jgi:hypothetical protein
VTQTGADRFVVGFGSVIGFVVGGFVGGVVGNRIAYDENDRAPDGLPWSDPSEEQNAAAFMLGIIGAGVGSAIGAMVAVPPAEKDLPPRTGVSGYTLHNPEFP